jgi:hypothetical protein
VRLPVLRTAQLPLAWMGSCFSLQDEGLPPLSTPSPTPVRLLALQQWQNNAVGCSLFHRCVPCDAGTPWGNTARWPARACATATSDVVPEHAAAPNTTHGLTQWWCSCVALWRHGRAAALAPRRQVPVLRTNVRGEGDTVAAAPSPTVPRARQALQSCWVALSIRREPRLGAVLALVATWSSTEPCECRPGYDSYEAAAGTSTSTTHPCRHPCRHHCLHRYGVVSDDGLFLDVSSPHALLALFFHAVFDVVPLGRMVTPVLFP